jgi:WD40 repeat protein
MDTAERTAANESRTVFDGFISYSHAADDLLAPRMQSALQRFAKPWWKRRALRIFRDESSLSANPHLWSSITEAMDQSGWFVLLLSPDAAQSPWVNQETEYWKTQKDPSRILPVLTDGSFEWADGDVSGTAVPEQLKDSFSEEPRWVDMRFALRETDLDIKDPRFADAIADIASALRGVPKDELASEEVRQHRRTIRTAWTGVAAIAVLAIAATVFAVQSADNAREAERQAEIATQEANRANQEADRANSEADRANQESARAQTETNRANENAQLAEARELAASAIGVVDQDPELATLLALQAIDLAPSDSEPPVEVINALWRAGSENRLVEVIKTNHPSIMSLSPQGDLLAVTTAYNVLELRDLVTGETRWKYSEDTVDFFTYSEFSSDGRIALSVIDSSAESAPARVNKSDDLPNRIVVLDVESGDVLHQLEFPQCQGIEVPSWSPDSSFLAFGSGSEGCERDDTINWIEVYDTSSWESVALLPIGGDGLGPIARWSDSGSLFSLRPYGEAVRFEPPNFGDRQVLNAAGMGDVSPDGSRLVLSHTDVEGTSDFDALVFDVDAGGVVDVYPGESNPSLPRGMSVEPDGADGHLAFIGTTGSSTFVYDLTRGAERFVLPTGDVFSLAYDPGSAHLYTSGATEDVRIWDLGSNSVGLEATGDLGTATWVNGNSFSIGPTLGALNAIDFDDFTWYLQFFDLESSELLPDPMPDYAASAFLDNGMVLGFDFAAQREILLDPQTGDQVVLDACEESDVDDNGEQVCVGEGDPEWYSYRAVADKPHVLALGHRATGEPTGHMAVLDPDTGAVLDRYEGPPLPRELITSNWAIGPLRGGVVAVDRETGEALFEMPFTNHFELSPDGSLLAMNPRTTDLLLVDTSTWEEVLRIPGSDRIRGISFNDRGTSLAVSGLESLYVVDLDSLRVVQQIRLGGVSDMYWSDDESLLVGTNGGLFGTISLSTQEFLAATRERLRRGFTQRECDLYRLHPCPTLEKMRSG